MSTNSIEIREKGKGIRVPRFEVNGATIVVRGRWTKVASVYAEDWSETEIQDPESCLKKMKQARSKGFRADIFTFTQRVPDVHPKFEYAFERESVAAIPIASFSDWWENRVSSYLRKDVRKAKKLGVEIRPVQLDDEFVKGIMAIYDESPIRQGRRFWHYKKSFEAVKAENSSYLERADFLGAYLGKQLIGFLKIVYVDRIARLMQIIAMDAHRDKRVMNALIAAAVELCHVKGYSYLTYGKYRYAQGEDSVTAFKHRNGFEEFLVPRYYVPLTMWGEIALRLRLHYELRELMPESVLRVLKRIRASFNRNPAVIRKAV